MSNLLIKCLLNLTASLLKSITFIDLLYKKKKKGTEKPAQSIRNVTKIEICVIKSNMLFERK